MLVELLPDGRVRNASATAEPFEGYLPEGTTKEPRDGAGLFRYAQRKALLHLARPGGAVVGQLHPGAFVSVALPAEGEREVRVASLGIQMVGEAPPIFVDEGALGATPLEPAAIDAPPDTRATRLYMSPTRLHLHDPWTGARYAYELDVCEEVWNAGSRFWHYASGVELIGEDDYDAGAWARHGIYGTLQRCPLANVGPSPARVDVAAGARFEAALLEGATIHWIVEREDGGLECVPFQLAKARWSSPSPDRDPWGSTRSDDAGALKSRPRTRASLRVVTTPEYERAEGLTWYPVTYQPAEGSKPARVILSSLRVHGDHMAMRCECGFTYAVVGATAGELQMLGGQVPEDVTSFEPGTPERWFFSGEGCEAAAREAAQALKHDGGRALRLGIHPMEYPTLY